MSKQRGPLSEAFIESMRKSWDEYRESFEEEDERKQREGTLFRLNLTSWMGERVGPLLDEIDRLRAQEESKVDA